LETPDDVEVLGTPDDLASFEIPDDLASFELPDDLASFVIPDDVENVEISADVENFTVPAQNFLIQFSRSFLSTILEHNRHKMSANMDCAVKYCQRIIGALPFIPQRNKHSLSKVRKPKV
jgi:hypothetical protein